MQQADRPGIDLNAETVKAIRWMEDNRNKSGNRTRPERFLGHWFNQAKPKQDRAPTGSAPVGGGTYQEENAEQNMRAYEEACAARDRERGKP